MLKLAFFVTLVAINALALSPMECDPIHEELQVCTGRPNVKCDVTCDNFRSATKHQICPCVEKCICRQQFVRNTSTEKCVYRFQCPNSWWPWAGQN